MDTTKAVTHVGLCAGYGGIELGLSRAIPNLRSVALCEIEAFACANLVAKMETGLMDAAPIWTYLKTFPWGEFRGRVDFLTGGYPCQPFSAAGKRLGKDDPRHLWPFIADGIAAMRPSVCFFENVEGHISMGLSDVIEDLAGMGYRTTWGIFSAREVGAPHQRKRVFILAYLKCEGLERNITELWDSQGWKEPSGSIAGGSCTRGDLMANTKSARGWEDRESTEPWPVSTEQSSSDPRGSAAGEVREGQPWPSRPGQPQHGWEPPRVVANLKIRGGEILDDTTDTNDQRWEPTMGGAGRNLGRQNQVDSSAFQHRGADGSHGRDQEREAQPSMGRDIDGTVGGMDASELYTTCDNRTDELRLLGNGVVPATAERAFRTLLKELLT